MRAKASSYVVRDSDSGDTCTYISMPRRYVSLPQWISTLAMSLIVPLELS